MKQWEGIDVLVQRLDGIRPQLHARKARLHHRHGRAGIDHRHVVGDQRMSRTRERGDERRFSSARWSGKCDRAAVDGHGAGVKDEASTLCEDDAEERTDDGQAKSAVVGVDGRIDHDLRAAANAKRARAGRPTVRLIRRGIDRPRIHLGTRLAERSETHNDIGIAGTKRQIRERNVGSDCERERGVDEGEGHASRYNCSQTTMTAPPRSAGPLLDKLDPAAEAQMRQLISGALRTQAIYTVAKFGIADHLALGPRTADDLAQRAGAHAPALRRLLRFLVTCGVFIENEEGCFALTALGELMQTAHPRSLRPSAIRAGEDLWRTTAALYEAVRTGTTPHDTVHGMSFFERLGKRGKEAEFAARMNSSTVGLADAIAAHESLSDAKTLVDAGGGNGALLVSILERRATLRGILLESEAMIGVARPLIEQTAVRDRCELVAGDFFDAIPRGDVVLLSWVLHDWDDEQARQILRACHDSGAETLLIIEVVMPDRAERIDDAAPGIVADPFSLDLQMLLLTGGKERTRGEYEALLKETGWVLKSQTPLPSKRGASLITVRVQR